MSDSTSQDAIMEALREMRTDLRAHREEARESISGLSRAIENQGKRIADIDLVLVRMEGIPKRVRSLDDAVNGSAEKRGLGTRIFRVELVLSFLLAAFFWLLGYAATQFSFVPKGLASTEAPREK